MDNQIKAAGQAVAALALKQFDNESKSCTSDSLSIVYEEKMHSSIFFSATNNGL